MTIYGTFEPLGVNLLNYVEDAPVSDLVVNLRFSLGSPAECILPGADREDGRPAWCGLLERGETVAVTGTVTDCEYHGPVARSGGR